MDDECDEDPENPFNKNLLPREERTYLVDPQCTLLSRLGRIQNSEHPASFGSLLNAWCIQLREIFIQRTPNSLLI